MCGTYGIFYSHLIAHATSPANGSKTASYLVGHCSANPSTFLAQHKLKSIMIGVESIQTRTMAVMIPFVFHARDCGKGSLTQHTVAMQASIHILLSAACCIMLCHAVYAVSVLCHAVHHAVSVLCHALSCCAMLCVLCHAVLATYVFERSLPTVCRRWLHMCAMCWLGCTVNPMMPPLSCAWWEVITEPIPVASPPCRQCSAMRSWNGHAVKVCTQCCP